MRRLIVLFFVFNLFYVQVAFSVDYTCANPKSYSLVYTNNIEGDVNIIGNMSLCADQDNDKSCDDPGLVRNNSIYMIDINNDGNSSTFNLSKAKLELPVGSEILWAKVYWQGMLYKGIDHEKGKTAKILFKTPSASSYVTIDETSPQYSHNWVYYSSDRFYYQASADVTDMVKSGGEGWYTVANVYSRTGSHSIDGLSDLPPGHPFVVVDDDDGIPPGGSYGGWSLVVAYKNKALPLKNISIFDGYMGIVGIYDVDAAEKYAKENNCSKAGVAQSIDIPLSGFLTPKTGKVKSKFIIFAGEGDVGEGCTWARGDMLQLAEKDGTKHLLTNARNPSDDTFNSSISEFGVDINSSMLDPYYSTNKNGIDIDTFDTSTIIQNNQTSTTITINTNGDGYHPSVFALSTQIYESQLCYIEDYYLNGFLYDGKAVSPGTELDVKTTIKNEGVDRAKEISIRIPSAKILKYTADSIKLDGTPKTDLLDGDEAEAIDENISARIGVTASGMSGGYLDGGATTNLEYKVALFYDENSSTLDRVYEVSYIDDTLGVAFKNLELKRCSGSTAITPTVYKPLVENFNVLERGKPITDANITTKVVNKDINLSLVSLDESLSALRDLNSTVGVMLIDTASGNVIKNIGSINLSGQNGRAEIPAFKYDKANKQVNARVYYCKDIFGNIAADWKSCYPAADDVCNPLTGFTCKTSDSLDDFAIRPDSYVVTVAPYAPDTALKAGKDFNLSIKALDADGNLVTNFAQSASSYKLDINETKSATSNCENNMTVTYVKSNFTDGIASMDANYPDVGQLSYEASEILGSEFAKVDEDDTPDNLRLITPVKTISDEIEVAKMILGWSFKDGDMINGFTYYNDYNSSDPDASLMAAEFDINATMLSFNDSPLKNFTDGCYAKDINISFTADLWSDTNNTYEIVAEYSDKDDVKIPQNILKSKLPETIQTGNLTYNYKLEDIFFEKGIAEKKARFNLKRDASKALNPLKFTVSNISATVDTVSQTDTTAKTIKFVYARAHIPDQEAVGKILKAKVFYEIYCNECSKANFGISTFHESVDNINWYILDSINESLCSYSPSHNTPLSESGDEVSAGYGGVHVDDFTSEYMFIRSQKTPAVVKMDYKPKKYLIYNPFNKNATTQSFTATFSQRPADWAGKGDVGLSVDLNVSQRHGTDKIEW